MEGLHRGQHYPPERNLDSSQIDMITDVVKYERRREQTATAFLSQGELIKKVQQGTAEYPRKYQGSDTEH